MKKNIQFFVVSYIVFLVLSVSCISNCGPHPNKSKITAFYIAAKEINYTPVVMNEAPISGNSVIYNKYGIRIVPEVEGYYGVNYKTPFNFLESAYACSFVIPPAEDKIQDMEITSTTNYNTDFLTGVELKNLFDVIVKQLNGDIKYDLATYLATNPKINETGMTLVLKEAPETTASFEFRVKIYLEGEGIDMYEFTTSSIEIRIN